MKQLSRREFLSLSAGGGVLAANEFGRKQFGRIVADVVQPEPFRPGMWLHYMTTCRECPAGCGMMVRCQNGRAVKCEPNPTHPVSRGGLCVRGQSAVQGLYDPNRLRQPYREQDGRMQPTRDWKAVLKEIARRIRSGRGRVCVVSNLQTGALAEAMGRFVEAFGERGSLLLYEPFDYGPVREAHRAVFGRGVVPRYRLDEAEVILSFGAN